MSSFLLIAIIILLFAAVWISIRPRNDRDWSPDQAVLPFAEFHNRTVTIRNVRHCRYSSELDYEVRLSDRTFRLADLTAVYYIVTPFWGYDIGHTFVTFEFNKREHLSISVEVRKKRGESYNVPRSFFKQFEIMYVIADEEDVLKLRTIHRGNDVFLYKMKTSRDEQYALLLDMLHRANTLRDKPEFYHPFTNACTNNLIRHFNRTLHTKVPFHYSRILPARSDKHLHERGLIETPLPYHQARLFHYVSERARQCAGHPNFSQKIREI